MLSLGEVDADGQLTTAVLFDADDVDAAFAELDTRYLAGEASVHAGAWSAIVGANAAFNRREMPATTADWVNVDHRRGGMAFAPGDQTAYIRATWDVAPHISNRIVAVHRLGDRGAVFTQSVQATSRDGFNGKWRDVVVLTVDGDMINHCEVFDEADFDDAVARFDELMTTAPRIENAATRANTTVAAAFNRRDIGAYLAAFDAAARYDDRRKGLRSDGPIDSEFVQSMFSVASPHLRLEVEVVGIRGQHFALSRYMFRDFEGADPSITVEVLLVAEVTDAGLMSVSVMFDPDDIDGAFNELTARWIASGEVAHPEVIETAQRVLEALNRHDWDAFETRCTGATYINHRQLRSGDTFVDYLTSVQVWVSLVPDLWVEPTEIFAYSAVALLGHYVAKGTSSEGLAIEVPLIMLTLHAGDRINHIEPFEFEQRDLALARFEELSARG